MYSTNNEEKSIVAGRFIRALKSKTKLKTHDVNVKKFCWRKAKHICWL